MRVGGCLITVQFSCHYSVIQLIIVIPANIKTVIYSRVTIYLPVQSPLPRQFRQFAEIIKLEPKV